MPLNAASFASIAKAVTTQASAAAQAVAKQAPAVFNSLQSTISSAISKFNPTSLSENAGKMAEKVGANTPEGRKALGERLMNAARKYTEMQGLAASETGKSAQQNGDPASPGTGGARRSLGDRLMNAAKTYNAMYGGQNTHAQPAPDGYPGGGAAPHPAHHPPVGHPDMPHMPQQFAHAAPYDAPPGNPSLHGSSQGGMGDKLLMEAEQARHDLRKAEAAKEMLDQEKAAAQMRAQGRKAVFDILQS